MNTREREREVVGLYGVTQATAHQFVASVDPMVIDELIRQKRGARNSGRSYAELGTTPEVGSGLIALAAGGGLLSGIAAPIDAVGADIGSSVGGYVASQEASSGGAAAAGGAGAGGAATKVASTASNAAKAAGSVLTKDVLAGGLAVGVAELLKAYGVRVIEVIAGAGLIYFGLGTLARGGQPPTLPRPI